MAGIRFAVAGLKHFHILEFIKGMKQLPGSQFTGFFDDDPQLRDYYGKEFEVPAFDSIRALVESMSPEVVGVAEANGRKGPVICELLERGCHVLADKPLVTSFEHLDQVEAAADRASRQLGLMLLQRYHGPLRAVRSRLRSGELGKLVSLVSVAPHKLCPESRPKWMFEPDLYGGILNDLAIHDVDVLRWMWGEDPVAATASEGCLRFTEFSGFTDHAAIFFEFADSSTALLRVDWLTPETFPTHGDGRHFFECTEGTIEVQAAPDIHQTGKGRIIFDPWDGSRHELSPEPPANSLYAEFVALCRGATEAVVVGADAIRSTRLALYAREAARTGTKIDLRGKL